jgi:hypothetical protein
MGELVAGNQVLAAKCLRTSSSGRIRRSARLRLRKWINHLQWGGVVTKQLFRLAPQRLYLLYANRKSAVWCRGSHSQGSLVSEVTFDIVGRSKLRPRFQIWS